MAKVNLSDLAEFYGKNRTTIRNWINKGCPVEERGGRGKPTVFDSVAVAEWLEEQAIKNAVGDTHQADAEELRRRKLAAETALAEIEAAKAKGEVVFIDEAITVITNDILDTKAKLRNLPGRVVPQIIGETDENRLTQVIESELNYVLEELQNRFIRVEDEADTPAEPSKESVGTAA